MKTGLEPQQAMLLALFAQSGCLRAETSLLQPVDVFLDLSGEDIRRRLYLTSDAEGRELCLRPEYTIPVARDYLSSKSAGERSEFAYIGPVFRQRSGETGEFIQAGVEMFGREDREAADAELLTLAMQAAGVLGLKNVPVRIGDVSLLEAVMTALNVPTALHRRLMRGLAAGKSLAAIMPQITGKSTADGLSGYSGVLTALKGTDPSEARAFVKDLLSIAGINSVGGRSTADIAERFLAQSEGIASHLNADAKIVLDQFLKLEGDPDSVSRELRHLSNDAKLDLNGALDRYDARIGFMAAQGIDVTSLAMQTRFVRSLDYYTSFIFEISSSVIGKPAIAGGRYDRLLGRLGAKTDIPAVGFSIWIDRAGSMDKGAVA